jgi:hypothetical protein
MKRYVLIGLLAILAACSPADNDGGTNQNPNPAGENEAPLNDDAVGPSEQQEEGEAGEGD